MLNVDIASNSAVEPDFSYGCKVKISDRMPTGELGLKFYSSPTELEPFWLELETRAHCSPFQRYSWVKVLYDNCCERNSSRTTVQSRPFLIAGYRNSKPVFILPLVLTRDIFGKRLEWIGAGVSDYNGMIMDREFAKQVPDNLFDQILTRIRAVIPDLDAVYLTRNAGSYDAVSLMNGCVKHSWKAEYGVHTLNLSRSWKALFETVRSKKSRLRLRSKFRSLKKTGRISFKQVRDPEDRLAATRQILDWKSKHLAERGSRNPFGSERSPSMTRHAINASAWDASDSSIKVIGIYRDDELLAGMLAFIANRNFYYLVSAYSPNVPRKFSIGTLLLVKTLEFAARAGLRQYDFLLGDEAYKYHWCDNKVPLMNHMVPFTLRGKFHRLGIKAAQSVKETVLNSPVLSGLARRVIRSGLPIQSLKVVKLASYPNKNRSSAPAKLKSSDATSVHADRLASGEGV